MPLWCVNNNLNPRLKTWFQRRANHECCDYSWASGTHLLVNRVIPNISESEMQSVSRQQGLMLASSSTTVINWVQPPLSNEFGSCLKQKWKRMFCSSSYWNLMPGTCFEQVWTWATTVWKSWKTAPMVEVLGMAKKRKAHIQRWDKT